MSMMDRIRELEAFGNACNTYDVDDVVGALSMEAERDYSRALHSNLYDFVQKGDYIFYHEKSLIKYLGNRPAMTPMKVVYIHSLKRWATIQAPSGINYTVHVSDFMNGVARKANSVELELIHAFDDASLEERKAFVERAFVNLAGRSLGELKPNSETLKEMDSMLKKRVSENTFRKFKEAGKKGIRVALCSANDNFVCGRAVEGLISQYI